MKTRILNNTLLRHDLKLCSNSRSEEAIQQAQYQVSCFAYSGKSGSYGCFLVHFDSNFESTKGVGIDS
jgi:hypothetical protein